MRERRRSWSPHQSLLLIVAMVVVFVIAVGPVRRALWSASNGVMATVQSWSTSLSHRWLPGREGASVKQERDDLRRQVARLAQQLKTAQKNIEAAESIKRLEAFVQDKKLKAVTAPIIAFSPDPGIQSIVIGQGRTSGLRTGQAVVANDGVMIGVVRTVHERTATVLLLQDGHAAVAGRVQNEPQSLGLVKGERGLSVVMDYLPRNDAVTAGQIVVTAGSDPMIPPDLLIGPIRSVATRPGDIFQHAVISITLPYERLTYASVIIR